MLQMWRESIRLNFLFHISYLVTGRSSIYTQVFSFKPRMQFEPYMEQLTGSKLVKEYDKAVYCYLVYLTSMKSTSCKILN